MTTLRIIERPGPARRWAPDGALPGDMWRAPELDADGIEAWAIVLPNGAGVWFTTDKSSPDPPGARWSVTGTPPFITVTPSIDAGVAFHGFITNGEMG